MNHKIINWRSLRAFILGLAILNMGFVSTDLVAAKSKGIFNYGNGAEPKSIDPHVATGVPEHHIIAELFEGLVGVHPKTVEPVPAVAESWKVSNKGLLYTFKLRKNAKWSNGDPVTANDFVYAWRRLVNPKTAAKYAEQGYYIKNGEAINKGKIKDLKKLGVTAVDNHTLKVTMEKPTPFFLGLLYHYSMYPLHKKTVTKHGDKWIRPENIVSNGAFKLKKWQLNKVIEVVPNPNYWDAAKVKLKQINFIPVENLMTEERMFRAKDLHVTNTVPLEKLPFWQRKKNGEYQQHPYLGTYFYRINTTRKHLKDKRVRRALSLAIDRKRLIKYVTKAGQAPAQAFTPPGTGGYEPKDFIPIDYDNPAVKKKALAEARKLLADAGYPGGKDFPGIEILYNTQDAHKKIALAIQQMWKKNLGINCTILNQEWKVYLATQQTLNYDVARAGWIGDYNDPNTFLDMWVTDRGNNETGWSNKKYDALIAKASKETDLKKRKKIFGQAEAILMEELPVIPIYVYTRTYLKNKQVKGWYPNIMAYHPMKYVSLD